MKKTLNDYIAEAKKILMKPKTVVFIAIGILAFVIHPLIGLIFVGVGINFLMSFYTSKGVLEREPSAEEGISVVNPDTCETEEHP